MGESVLVVGGNSLIRVHVHTQEPQVVLDYSSLKGVLKDISMESLDEQVEKFKGSVKVKTKRTKE